jgi:hypothetical protein
MNRQTKWLLALIPVVLLVGWAVTHEVLVILHERAIAQAEKDRRMAEINSVKSFAASTNAIVDWQKTLCNGDTGTHLFSTDLETVLVRPDGRGMMFYGELKDILHSNDNSDTAVFRAHGAETSGQSEPTHPVFCYVRHHHKCQQSPQADGE